VWNVVIDGFGNHDPGAGRYNGERTRWDTLHRAGTGLPGSRAPYTVAGLRARVAAHLDDYPPESAPTVPPLRDTPLSKHSSLLDED